MSNMAVLHISCVLIFVGVFGCAYAQDADVESHLEILERKLAAIALKGNEQQVMLTELTTNLYQQERVLKNLESENKLLLDKVTQLESEPQDLLIQKPRQSNDKERAPRTKRLILNSSYEGPVAFMASFGSNCQNNIGINQNVVFNTVKLNLGGAFNQLHGVFMAPRDGVYFFSASIMSDTQSHSKNVHAAISVNGKNVAKILAISEANQHRDQGSNTLIANLKRGDQVWVKNVDSGDATICGLNGYSTFSGYLLYAY